MTPDQIAKANAELHKSALEGVKPLTLAPGFSRVFGAANEENGFNRFPCATAPKPLKRLNRHSCSFTRLKPGANERPHEIASARIAEAKEFVN